MPRGYALGFLAALSIISSSLASAAGPEVSTTHASPHGASTPAPTDHSKMIFDPSLASDLYIQGLVGMANLSNAYGTGIGYGLGIDHYLDRNFGLGAIFRGGTHSYVSSMQIGVEGLFRLDQGLSGLGIGGFIGMGRISSAGFGNSSLAYGGKLYFDTPLAQNSQLSLGAEVSVTWVRPSAQNLTLISPMAYVKFGL